MGYIETKQKAQAYDDMKRSADYKNAQVAQQVQQEWEAKQAAMKQAQLEDAHNAGMQKGLAAAVNNPMMLRDYISTPQDSLVSPAEVDIVNRIRQEAIQSKQASDAAYAQAMRQNGQNSTGLAANQVAAVNARR